MVLPEIRQPIINAYTTRRGDGVRSQIATLSLGTVQHLANVESSAQVEVNNDNDTHMLAGQLPPRHIAIEERYRNFLSL